jgi:hypothetical protein
MEQNKWQNPINNASNTTLENTSAALKSDGVARFFDGLDWFTPKTNWKSEKWSISSSKIFDQIWFANQKRKYSIMIFEFNEKFENTIFMPALFGTRKFLLNFLKGNDVKNVANELTDILRGLEGIWFNKYRQLFEKFFAKVVNETHAPEYFFFKYYYQFLTAFRTISILLCTDVIIPNVILANAPINIAEQYEIATIDYYGNIKNSIHIFSSIVEEIFKKTIDQYENELILKGKTWSIDYEFNDFDFSKIIIPNIGIDLDEFIENYRRKLLVNN